MDLETAPRNAQAGKFLIDPSEAWLRLGQPDEPDLAVDGLRDSSLLARFLGRWLKRR